jgi:Fe-S-cluster-containing dehydrogenase component
MGASDVFSQARILELYDPDRLRVSKRRDGERLVEISRDEAMNAVRAVFGTGSLKGVAILSEPNSSPTLARLKKQFEERGGRWFNWTSLGDDHTRAGSKAAFDRPVRAHYHFDQAAVIVVLDGDPLGMDAASLVNSRRFAAGRDAEHGKMSRLYVVESDFSLTGAAADHRLAVPSFQITGFVAALAEEIEKQKNNERPGPVGPWRERTMAAMAHDLAHNLGAGIILAGERQPPAVHAMVHRLNELLGNHGKTITFTELPDADRPLLLDDAVALAGAVESGEVSTLVILGGNPVYDFPASIDLAAALGGLTNCVHLTVYQNETSLRSSLVISAAHPLEGWNDGLAHDGSWCIGQPLIAPLFGGLSEIETLASLLGNSAPSGLDLVRETAATRITADFDSGWNQSVHDGFVAGSEARPVSVSTKEIEFPVANSTWASAWNGSSVELVFLPSRSVYDGRFANSAWLQELPDFITKIAWDNAALMAPETAEKLGLKQNTTAEVEANGQAVTVPVHIVPGMAAGSVAIETGFGRKAAGRVGGDEANGIEPVGQSVAPLRNVTHWTFAPAAVRNGGRKYTLASVQELWGTDKTGADEIQRRMFIDAKTGSRSSLIREGRQFLRDHPPGEPGHDGPAGQAHGASAVPATPVRSRALPVIGALPITPVSHDEPVTRPSNVPLPPHLAGRDDHEHGHAPQWPGGFHMHHELKDLTPGVSDPVRGVYNPNGDNKWGMSIDLNSCTGCSACVVACQAENNIPIVGKWQVWRGREMHWLRIDRYFGTNIYNKRAAADGDIQIAIQPVTCHHCENAPCETVCPVAATVHSDEGLNDMVYNRCIGTRYCGNNCPYKVRRYNYLNYSDAETFLKYPGADRLPAEDRALQNLMMNPEVTIRSRGVMEKCTYCVQRIQNTKILAKNQQRKIGPNEITTACQDACPTGAIRFGDLLNQASDVAHAHASPRSYVMLEELNNRPRTKYLARVRNPHPALVDWDDRGPRPGMGTASASQ